MWRRSFSFWAAKQGKAMIYLRCIIITLALAVTAMPLGCNKKNPNPTPGTTTISGLPIGPIASPGTVNIFTPTYDPTGTGIQYVSISMGDNSPITIWRAGILYPYVYTVDGTYIISVTNHYRNRTSDTYTQKVIVDLTPLTITIRSITIRGKTPDPSSVTINNLADDDGTADSIWSKKFNLDGGVLPNSLPSDPRLGTRRIYNFDLDATSNAGVTEPTNSVQIIIEP